MNLLFLTCANKEEAKKIAKTLLEKRLIVCAKVTDVDSQFLWNASLGNAKEALLLMESHESKFSDVEKIVQKLHSYKQFVLVGFPVTHTSTGVENWVKSEMSL